MANSAVSRFRCVWTGHGRQLVVSGVQLVPRGEQAQTEHRLHRLKHRRQIDRSRLAVSGNYLAWQIGHALVVQATERLWKTARSFVDHVGTAQGRLNLRLACGTVRHRRYAVCILPRYGAVDCSDSLCRTDSARATGIWR